MTKKERITKKLQAVGAAWATSSDRHVSPNDPMGSGRAYHIHPDRSYPHVGAILRFRTLDAIAEWCKMREKQAKVMDDAPPDPGPDATEAEYVAWERTVDRLHTMQEEIANDFWASVS